MAETDESRSGLMRFGWAIVIAVVVVAAFAGYAIGHGSKSSSEATPASITVNGTGTIDAAPREADFTFGVTTVAANSKDASDANATAMAKVIAALEAQGVDQADIRTDQVSLGQNYGSNGQTDGYAASNSVTVRVRKLDQAGKIVDAAVHAGANQSSGPDYVTTDQQPAYEAALKAAVDDSHDRAQALADASGLTLGAAHVVTETTSSGPVAFDSAASSAGKATPVVAGDLHIEADVTVTYDVS